MKKSVFYAKKFIFTVMIFAFILILASCGTENSNETISETESTESITVSDYIPDSGINEQYLSFVKKYPYERYNRSLAFCDGYVIYTYKCTTVSRLEGTELVKITNESGHPDGGDWEEIRAELLKENGITDEEMEFDFIPAPKRAY